MKFLDLNRPEFSPDYAKDGFHMDEAPATRQEVEAYIGRLKSDEVRLKQDLLSLMMPIDELRRTLKVQTFKAAKAHETPIEKVFRFLKTICQRMYDGTFKCPNRQPKRLDQRSIGIEVAVMHVMNLPKPVWERHRKSLCDGSNAQFLETMLTLKNDTVDKVWIPRTWFGSLAAEWPEWIKNDRSIKSVRPTLGPRRGPDGRFLPKRDPDTRRFLPSSKRESISR